jgi:tripartite-type tricarboxylate transporter receptor subunit TctC
VNGAATWLARQIRFIVPFASGRGTDFLARLFGARLASRLGEPVVVANRPADC